MKKLTSKLKKSIVIFTISLFISSFAISQNYFLIPKKTTGISLISQVCSNGYGTQYLPTIFYKQGRKTYSIAPTIQKKKLNLSGLQINYEYALTGADVKFNNDYQLELFVFVTLAYHKGAILGKNTERTERTMNYALAENNISKLRFSSTETYVGFGLKLPILKKFKWSSSIGFGYFQSINHPKNLYYRAQNFGLIINTGISMELKRNPSQKNKYTLRKTL